MFSTIPSAYYWSDEVFWNEYERLYKSSWVFAGFTSELKENRDFLTFDFFNHSIVVQNFDGEIKAFQNVCTHRFNKIQHEAFGNRPLLCNYHFWGFDKNGYPKSVPRKASFELSEQELECLKLKQYEVEVCGKFLFINLGQAEPTLHEFLGEYAQQLEEISTFIGDRFSWNEVPHQANWKLLIENVLECYHCSSVHSNSFFKMGYGQRSPENISVLEAHSSCDFPKAETAINGKRNKIMDYLEERPLKHNSYKHFFIFPNLVFSSTEGLTFYFGQLLPKTATETVLRTRIFDSVLNGAKIPASVHSFFQEQSATISNSLLIEDKDVVETVQKGIMQVDQYAYLGNEEVRIRAFHETYMKLYHQNNSEIQFHQKSTTTVQ
jgi:phenylpropionate dioxygenase-like ring-hydroxylating dioxygenase large terminal subunit